MGSPFPTLRGDPFDGPDLNLAAPLDQMIAWLEVASHEGAEAYLPLWQRLMASVGGQVGLMWDSIWPTIIVGQSADLQSAHRREIVDEFWEHLRRNHYREALLRWLIGDGDGVRHGAFAHEVGEATNKVILDFLFTEGRILIAPDDQLTVGGGIPTSYLNGDEARREEVCRASRAYLTATCCAPAAAIIRRWVATLGARTENGWTELTSEHVEWWRVHSLYAAAREVEQAYDRNVWTPEWEAANRPGDPARSAMSGDTDAEMERLQDARCDIDDMLVAEADRFAAAGRQQEAV